MAPYCFILSWNRPIYLWATLESLYRNTAVDMNFVLLDNNSTDPLVAHVVQSFERRGMFKEVQMCSDNIPNRVELWISQNKPDLGEYFFFVENDVEVPASPCWATTYIETYNAHQNVGMVGSLCDKTDFVDEEKILSQNPGISQKDLDYYVYGGSRAVEKTASLPTDRDSTVGDFPNPPGRLLLLDTAAIAECGFETDYRLAKNLVQSGYSWYITPKFVHRHLSLMNYYDYPLGSNAMPLDYEKARDLHFNPYKRNLFRRVVRKIKQLF